MISIAYLYESIFNDVDVKPTRKKSFPSEEINSEIVKIKKIDKKSKPETIIVKPEDNEPVIIRRKGK